MLLPISILAALLLLIMVMQIVWGNRFVAMYHQTYEHLKDDDSPHVGVIMSLRGADPYLKDCLKGLLNLDYPGHEVHIVVDSDVDPAYEVVQQAVRTARESGAKHINVEILDVVQQTCSLKNAALLQGIRACSDHCSAYAWLDSDTVPYPGWLKDLVTPLRDQSVGATCGIRWFAPPTQTLANYVRHIWNSAALLQMIAFEIGWGGAFVIRRSVFEKANLADKWSRALFEDTLASNEVLAEGQRVRFVAAATMPNPETATLKWCLGFVTRQLLGLRFYHSAWKKVLFLGVFSGLVLMADAGLAAIALTRGKYLEGGIGLGAIVVLGVISGWLIRRSERDIGRFLQNRSVGGRSSILMLMLAAPVTQLVHLVALVRVYFWRDVVWRGIRYKIRSGMDLTRLNYAPYQPDAPRKGASDVTHSI
ncbi:MAG: glycosyltransferase family 2 protein [Planctomycetaceae bacterium]